MEFWIQKAYRRISDKDKKIFFVTFGILLLVHAFRLTNFIPNHDSLWNYYGNLDVVTSGRWTLTYAASISSYFDVQWLNGLLSIIYISISTVFIVKMLEIKNTFLGCLSGILLGAYPTVVCTFMYMYTADAYFLAMLLATLAAYFMTSRDWRKRLLGSVALGVAMGIYQVYLSFTLMLLILWLIKKILVDEQPIGKSIFNMIYSGVIGAVIYIVGLYLRLAGRELSSYQGIGDSTLIHSLGWYFKTIKQSYVDTYRLLFAQDAYGNRIIGYIMLALGIITLGIMLVKGFLLIKKKKWVSVLLVIVFLAAMPLAVYCLKVLSEGAVYHRLMVQSAALIWLLPVVLLDNARMPNKVRILPELMTLLLLIQVGNYIVGANINYLSAEISYEKSYALSIRIVDRLEQLEGAKDAKALYIAGKPDSTKYKDALYIKTTETMTGVPNGIIPYTNAIYVRMINQHIGGNYTELTDVDAISGILESEEFANMPTWPDAQSVRVIDDVVVVNLGE